MTYYILVDREPVQTDLLTWGRFMEGGIERRRVERTELGGVEVSTVFLGLDHGFRSGPPVLFETMVFGGEHDQWQDRYHTWSAAQSGHDRVVAALRDGRSPSDAEA